MKILIANLGSTSFKFRVFDMDTERLLARGGVDRIGSGGSRCVIKTAAVGEQQQLDAPDHAVALRHCIQQLADPRMKCLSDPSDLAAIGFKAVHAQGITGVQRVDERVLAAMEAYNDVAPAHNPPYVKAMRLLAQQFPDLPLVAAFETGFHETIPASRRTYAVPAEWQKLGVQRWGFHGASHRYIAERTGKIFKNTQIRLISCHLGGSSSICAIRAGKSVATSMGFSPQSGLPQNNRVGDFDPFALPVLMRATGKSLEELLVDLAGYSGLEALSGHRDLRDIETAMEKGDEQARLALEVFANAVRQYIGAYLVVLGGADAIVFTGGIGENSARMRAAICNNLDWFGIMVDPALNDHAEGETRFDAMGSRVQLWAMPTNEELIVARQTRDFLKRS